MFQRITTHYVIGVLTAVERYTSVWMATCSMPRQGTVKKKWMPPVLRQYLIHVRGGVTVHMQTSAPTAGITIGMCTWNNLADTKSKRNWIKSVVSWIVSSKIHKMLCTGDQGFKSTMFPKKNVNVQMQTFLGSVRNVCILPEGISRIFLIWVSFICNMRSLSIFLSYLQSSSLQNCLHLPELFSYLSGAVKISFYVMKSINSEAAHYAI
jgi:hypothetical protein